MRRIAVTAAPTRMTIVLLGITLIMTGCTEDPTRPTTVPDVAVQSFGLMEITLSGITSAGQMTATSRRIGSDVGPADRSGHTRDIALYSLDRLAEGANNGIQLMPISTGSFTRGERGSGGQRYLSATFAVRNASADSVAYALATNNVTLVAVSTDATLGDTPVSRMRRFDGAPAPVALASELRPTGAVAIDDGGALTVRSADVFQAFTEAEAAELALDAGLDNVFPYGFVVRNPDRQFDRQLAANPAADQFDGVLTFAFRVPLAADPADDAYEISIMVLAVSDSETHVTQSFEGQMVCADSLETRATRLRATAVTLLAGGGIYASLPTRNVAQIRTAGTAAAPTGTLPDAVTAAYPPAPDIVDLSGVTDVVPLIWEVVPSPYPGDDPATTLLARYGYYNGTDSTVTYPVSMDNFFVPGAASRGQPTEFQPGLHGPPNGGFEVRFNVQLTPVLNWSLGDEFVSAHHDAPGRPPCGYRF